MITVRSDPIKLSLRARRKASGAGPRRDIVGALSKIKTPYQNSNFMPPTRTENELLHKKYKSYLPAVNLKILTPTPNLTSNFEP